MGALTLLEKFLGPAWASYGQSGLYVAAGLVFMFALARRRYAEEQGISLESEETGKVRAAEDFTKEKKEQARSRIRRLKSEKRRESGAEQYSPPGRGGQAE
jgi:hypothetical protein